MIVAGLIFVRRLAYPANKVSGNLVTHGIQREGPSLSGEPA